MRRACDTEWSPTRCLCVRFIDNTSNIYVRFADERYYRTQRILLHFRCCIRINRSSTSEKKACFSTRVQKEKHGKNSLEYRYAGKADGGICLLGSREGTIVSEKKLSNVGHGRILERHVHRRHWSLFWIVICGEGRQWLEMSKLRQMNI